MSGPRRCSPTSCWAPPHPRTGGVQPAGPPRAPPGRPRRPPPPADRRRRRRVIALVAFLVVAAAAGATIGGLVAGGVIGGGSDNTGPLRIGDDVRLVASPTQGGCNTNFHFSATGTVHGVGTLVYRFERSDGSASADTSLPITSDEGS